MKTFCDEGKIVGFRSSFINRILILIGIFVISYSFKYYGTDGLFYSSLICLLLCEIIPNNPL